MEDIIMKTSEILDSIWNLNEGPNSYPEFRMRKLMEVCTNALISRL